MAEDYNSTTQRGPDSPSKKIVGNRRTFAGVVGEDDDGGADATATGLSHPSGVKHSAEREKKVQFRVTTLEDHGYAKARGSTQPAVLDPSAASPPEVSVGAGSSSLSLPVTSQVDEIDKAKIIPCRPLREAPRVLLKWAQDETKHKALLIAIARFKAGSFAAARKDWANAVVPFRRGRYARQPLARCDVRWRRFILRWAKSSTTLGLRYEVFLAAVRASLGLPPRPDFPEPEPVIMNDPRFAPPKVDNAAGPSQPRTQRRANAIVPRDFSQANVLALSQQSASRSPSPSGSESSATTAKAGKGKGKAPARKRRKVSPVSVAVDSTQPAADAAPAPTSTSQQPKDKAKGKRKPNPKFPSQKSTLENHFGAGAKSPKSLVGDSACDPIVIDIDTPSVVVNDMGTASSSATPAGEGAAGSSTSRSPRTARKRKASQRVSDSGGSEGEDVEGGRPAKRIRRSPRLAESSRLRL
ncbi:hypothetical protein BKA70DRAFT_1418583 [Coprinopsis sp. MPI-PUGE-AT-0042]|nr:hypothetical protein BKA70DRAFT_1418583 [Coprinopsis sp. MPI-PUGE-AT-0042]